MEIYCFVEDCGDGSATISWARSVEAVEEYMEENESCWANEGDYETLTLPDGFDINSLGIHYWIEDKN